MKLGVMAAVALAGLTGVAVAESLPGMRGVNHIGLTVPDMAQAEGFLSTFWAVRRRCPSGRSAMAKALS